MTTMVVQEEVTTHKKTRVISVVAATTIALACGTNVCLSNQTDDSKLMIDSMPTRHGLLNSPTSFSYRPLKATSSYGPSKPFHLPSSHVQ